MTFAELKTEVLRRAGENPALPRFYTAAEAGAAINAAQNVFAFLTLCLEDTVTLTVPLGAVLTPISSMAPRWIAPLRLEIDSEKLAPSTLADFRAANPMWIDPTQRGTPTRYAMLGWEGLVCWPSPAVQTTISARFATSPVFMSADSAKPDIPPEDHQAVVDYALFRLTIKEGAEPMAAAMAGLKDFLSVAARRLAQVKQRSLSLAYDTQPTERWLTLLESPQWPSMPQQ